jgi:hypothetical protein
MEHNIVTFNTYIQVYPEQPMSQPMGQSMGQSMSQPVGQPMSQPVGHPMSQHVSHPVDKKTDYFLHKHYDNVIKDKINFYLFNFSVHNRHEYIDKEAIYQYIDERINCIQNGEESEEDLYYYNIRNIKLIEADSHYENTNYSKNEKNPNKRARYNY